MLGRGTREEFEIGTHPTVRSIPIPVGATAFSAKGIWDEVVADTERFYGQIRVKPELNVLGSTASTDEQLLSAIFALIE